MATLTQDQLEGLGIDLAEIQKAFGPKKVSNKADGTIEIENHSLKEVLAAIEFIRKTGRNKNTAKRRIHFSRIVPGDYNGNHGSD